MRIIAGQWRGVPLLPPPGKGTRPILDQVKESVFNILGARLASPGELPPCVALDLFAGTGSLGLEALSRGARWCTFFEKHPATAAVLRRNIDRLAAQPRCEVRVADCWNIGLGGGAAEAAELVFVDPPYQDAQALGPATRVARLLEHLRMSQGVAADAMVILRIPTPAADPGLGFEHHTVLDRRRYGGMTVCFLRAGT